MHIRIATIMAMVVLALFGYPGVAGAFHDGGVATCDGCHTMHNSSGGARMQGGAGNAGANPAGTANAYLLQGSDQSSTCLMCHAKTSQGGYAVATYPDPAAGAPPVQLTPGGDFAWLKKNYSWITSYGAQGSSPGERHGHNIVAQDFGFTADTALTTAPGGTFIADKLACTSCHDPHGKYRINGNPVTTITTGGKPIYASGSYGTLPTAGEAVGVFRLLGGKLYQPKSTGYVFSYDPPLAVAPSSYNRLESSTDTRVAYGKNTTEWCANCHEAFHSVYATYVHPAGVTLQGTIAGNYNVYVKTGSIGGSQATAYTSMVPFQIDNSTDLAVLAAKSASTAGAASSDRITCLTCHRAHASGWDSMTRWNNKSEFLTVAGEYPGTDASAPEAQKGEFHLGRTKAEIAKTFYERPTDRYASFQRSLCNKCHIQD